MNCSPRHVVLAMKIPHLHKLVPEKMKIEGRVKIDSSDTVRWYERVIVKLVPSLTIPPRSPLPLLRYEG